MMISEVVGLGFVDVRGGTVGGLRAWFWGVDVGRAGPSKLPVLAGPGGSPGFGRGVLNLFGESPSGSVRPGVVVES
jgi:hypothetical protein